MDWTERAPQPPPGNADDPLDRITPTDPGWAPWVNDVVAKLKPDWTPGCKVGIKVERVSEAREYPLEGTNGTPWVREDNTRETVPPAEYRDYTRYTRKFARLKTQFFTFLAVTVTVDCGGDVRQSTHYFWRPEGPVREFTDRETAEWVETSGMSEVQTPDGTVRLKWFEDVQPWWGSRAMPSELEARDDPREHPFRHPLPRHPQDETRKSSMMLPGRWTPMREVVAAKKAGTLN